MSHPGHADAPHEAHAGDGLMKYIYVVLVLCVLSTLSFVTYFDPWPLDTAPVKRLFMMAVSCSKAMLVILFFMHVKYEANWKYVVTIPASLMAIILAVALVPDIGMRVNGFFGYGYSRERMRFVGQDADVEALEQATAALQGEPHGGSSDGH